MTKREAIEVYYIPEPEENSEKVKSLTVKIDEKYQVKAAFMEKQEVLLSFRGAKSFKATTKDMPSREKESLYRQFAEADMLAISPSIQLQINALVTEGAIGHASIIKIGDQRPGTISIFNALESSISSVKGLLQTRQGNLFSIKD